MKALVCMCACITRLPPPLVVVCTVVLYLCWHLEFNVRIKPYLISKE